MPIDNIISVPGRGCVVIGTVKRGYVVYYLTRKIVHNSTSGM